MGRLEPRPLDVPLKKRTGSSARSGVPVIPFPQVLVVFQHTQPSTLAVAWLDGTAPDRVHATVKVTPMTVRIGLLGSGFLSTFYLQGLQNVAGWEIPVVASPWPIMLELC